MKRIPFVPEIQLESPTGALIFNPKSGAANPESQVPDLDSPAMTSQLNYLRDRISDAAFGEGMEAVDADDLRYETRRALRTQEAEAKKRGYWLLDVPAAEKLQHAVLKYKPQNPQAAAMGFNFVPYARAVRAQTPHVEEAVTNGVTAQAS
jgi:hypothetical protein